MKKNVSPAVPEMLADVALIDGPTAAAVGGASASWWMREVREGRAPAPAIKRPRMTRWRTTEVRAFWSALDSKAET